MGVHDGAHDPAMLKRILAAFLWFYTGWYGGALLADFLGLSPMLGPVIGAAAAFLIVGDPRRIIWTAKSMAPGLVESATTVAANSSVAGASSDTEAWSNPV